MRPCHDTHRPARRPAGLACTLLLGVLATTACGGEETANWCEPTENLQVSCEGSGCVAAVIVDYARAEPRGYSVLRPEGKPIELADAEAVAFDHLTQVLGVEAPSGGDCDQEDQFIHCAMTHDTRDQYLVIIHQPTGQVLFAEPGMWGHPDRRGYDVLLPQGFEGAAALGCVDPADPPERQKFVTTGFPMSGPVTSTPDEALMVARQLNLTRQLTAGHAYRAFVISHAPAMGEFDGEAADWYVWMEIR